MREQTSANNGTKFSDTTQEDMVRKEIDAWVMMSDRKFESLEEATRAFWKEKGIENE